MANSKFYEYYTISIYADEKNQLVFDFFEKQHGLSYFNDALAYMGAHGWQLVNSTDFIGTDFKNIGILPLYVENYRSSTQTTLQILTFMRELEERPTLENNYFDGYVQRLESLQEREEKYGNLRELTIGYMKQKGYHLLSDRGDVVLFSIPGTPMELKVTITESNVIVSENGQDYSIVDEVIDSQKN